MKIMKEFSVWILKIITKTRKTLANSIYWNVAKFKEYIYIATKEIN